LALSSLSSHISSSPSLLGPTAFHLQPSSFPARAVPSSAVATASPARRTRRWSTSTKSSTASRSPPRRGSVGEVAGEEVDAQIRQRHPPARHSSSQWGFSQTTTMSLACLVCHGMSSPSNSLRSYSVSSSEEESRCGAAVACLARRVTPAGTSSVGTSKVTPFPPMVSGQVGTEGTPRLQRSRAVSRDLVRDWNFDEVIVAN